MIDPKGRWKIIWDTIMGFVFVSCYILDPLIYAFDLKPLLNLPLLDVIRAQSFLILFDMLLQPMTGTRKEEVIIDVQEQVKIEDKVKIVVRK